MKRFGDDPEVSAPLLGDAILTEYVTAHSTKPLPVSAGGHSEEMRITCETRQARTLLFLNPHMHD